MLATSHIRTGATARDRWRGTTRVLISLPSGPACNGVPHVRYRLSSPPHLGQIVSFSLSCPVRARHPEDPGSSEYGIQERTWVRLEPPPPQKRNHEQQFWRLLAVFHTWCGREDSNSHLRYPLVSQSTGVRPLFSASMRSLRHSEQPRDQEEAGSIPRLGPAIPLPGRGVVRDQVCRVPRG